MKMLQTFLPTCVFSAPLYAAGVSALPYATADGEVGIADWQPLKLLGR